MFNDSIDSKRKSQSLLGGPEEEANHGQEEIAPAGCCSTLYIFDLFRLYDNRFLFALGLQYLNTGMKQMTTLALLDMFKTQYMLEPQET